MIAKETIKKRLNYIDIAKGIAIFFVVLGHTYRPADLKFFIYSFHIPIFFFISGMFINMNKNFSLFFKSKIHTLILPYVSFYLISYTYWILVERHIRPGGLEIPAWKPLIGLFYGTDTNDYMTNNGALWFLPCLFISEIILFQLIINLKNKSIFIVVLFFSATIAHLISKYEPIKLPFGFNSSFMAIFFMGTGYIVKNYILNKDSKSNFLRILIVALLFYVMYFLTSVNGISDMDFVKFNNTFLFIIAGLLGIIACLILSKLITKNRVIQFLGINSLIIMGLSEPIKRAVIGTFSIIFNISVDEIRYSIEYSIACVIITIIILIPIIYIFNNYIYFLIGKKKQGKLF